MNKKWFWLLGVFLFLWVFVVSLQAILMPFLTAGLLAYLADPIVDWLEEKGLGRTGGTVIVFIMMSMMILLSVGIFIPLLIKQLLVFVQKIPDYIAWGQQQFVPYIQQYFGLKIEAVDTAPLRTLLQENWQKAGGLVQTLLQGATSSTLNVFVWLGNLLLIPVVFFYLLRDWDYMLANIRKMIPLAWLSRCDKLGRECNEVLSAFIRGQLVVMAALGGIYSIGLTIVGLDLALFIGTLAGVASVVPYLGAIVGIVSATIAAYMQFHELMPLIYVWLVFAVGQILEGMILTPLLVGDKIGLHPVAVIFAIMAGGQLAGFTGVLLALPAAAVLMVFLRHFHGQYIESDIYNSVNNEQ